MLELMQAVARTDVLSMGPTPAPSVPRVQPPTVAPSVSSGPSSGPTLSPTLSVSPSAAPTTSPTLSPVVSPTDGPALFPSQEPSEMPTSESTLICGIPPEERSSLIMGVLETVADPSDLRDQTTIQGQAAAWLIGEDELLVCPDDEKLIQRFALAVIYFATNGDSWLQCSANPLATDACGMEDPFKPGASRFLSAENECQWAGISCDSQLCVEEIEFGTSPLGSFRPLMINEHLTDTPLLYRTQQLGRHHSYRDCALDGPEDLGNGARWTDWPDSYRSWPASGAHLHRSRFQSTYWKSLFRDSVTRKAHPIRRQRQPLHWIHRGHWWVSVYDVSATSQQLLHGHSSRGGGNVCQLVDFYGARDCYFRNDARFRLPPCTNCQPRRKPHVVDCRLRRFGPRHCLRLLHQLSRVTLLSFSHAADYTGSYEGPN